jgi:hypothetical protein
VRSQSALNRRRLLISFCCTCPSASRSLPDNCRLVARVSRAYSHGGLQPLVVVGQLLLFARQFFGLLRRDSLSLLLARRAESPPHLGVGFLLAAGYVFGLARQIVHAAGGLLLAKAREQVARLFQALGRAPRIGLTLGGSGLPHILLGLAQLLDGALQLLG